MIISVRDNNKEIFVGGMSATKVDCCYDSLLKLIIKKMAAKKKAKKATKKVAKKKTTKKRK